MMVRGVLRLVKVAIHAMSISKDNFWIMNTENF